MKFSKVSVTALAFAAATTMVTAVTREECKENYLPQLLECIDNSTGMPDCELLPVPDFAMPQNQANEKGYWIQSLRDTPTSHVFAISENAYSSLIIVDIPVTVTGGGRKKKRYLRALQEGDLDALMEGGPSEMSEDTADREGEEAAPTDRISIAFVDFPPTFQQFDANGQDAGSHLISALGDILGIVGATIADVGKIEMMYTHAHMDHIGLANHTYTYVTETLGFDPSDIAIIATSGVKEHLEHAMKAGFSSYRAPLPTVTFEEGVKEHTVGSSTPLTMTTFDGHQYGDKDVVVFMEALGEENPAIMMVVDIVFPKWVPFFSFAISTDLLEYIAAHDILLEFPLGEDGYLVGGHLNQVGDRNDIILNKELTSSIVNGGALALETVDVYAVAGGTGAFTPGAPNFGNNWAAFGAYFDELARVCGRSVLEQHGCDFGGLDVTVYSSCIMAQSFWRVEV